MSDVTYIPPDESILGRNVRLRYATLMLYVLNILGAFFSFFFITLVARRLTVDDYGVWVMIMRYVTYFLIPNVIFSYWLPRNVSRGQNTARTGLYLSSLFGVCSIPFYIVIVYYISSGLDQPIVPLILSAAILLMEYLNASLNGISVGHAPQISGYSSLAMKAGQAIFGFILVGMLYTGLTGAVIAAIIGRVLMNIVSFFMNRSILKSSKFELGVLKTWFKTAWIPIISAAAGLIFTFDVVIVRLVFGSEIPIAYYGVCTSLLSIALFASVVVNTLYPRILAKRNLEDLREGIWLTLVLSIPIILTILLYAESLSALFGLKYLTAALPLQVFAIASLIQLISGLAGVSYSGLEGLDQNTSSAKILLKSALFRVNLIALFVYIVYLILLVSFTMISSTAEQIVVYWGVAFGITYLIYFLLVTYFIKRDFGQRFPFGYLLKNLVIFTIPILPMLLVRYVFGVPIYESFWVQVEFLVPILLLSLAGYFAVLYVLDQKFRQATKRILSKLLSRSSQIG